MKRSDSLHQDHFSFLVLIFLADVSTGNWWAKNPYFLP
jgi:hypothetical protein